jgi:hypothetical protein
MKMLYLSLIFLSLAYAVTTRREKIILFRVAVIILQYFTIVGYDSLAIISIGRRICFYGGLFHLQFWLIISYIKSLFKIGFSEHTSCGPALCTTMGLFRSSTSQGFLIAKILILSKNLFNKLKAYFSLVTNLVIILIEEIVLLLNCKPVMLQLCDVTPLKRRKD